MSYWPCCSSFTALMETTGAPNLVFLCQRKEGDGGAKDGCRNIGHRQTQKEVEAFAKNLVLQ